MSGKALQPGLTSGMQHGLSVRLSACCLSFSTFPVYFQVAFSFSYLPLVPFMPVLSIFHLSSLSQSRIICSWLWSVTHWLHLLTSTGAQAIIPARGLVCWLSWGWNLYSPIPPCLSPFPVFSLLSGLAFQAVQLRARLWPSSFPRTSYLHKRAGCCFETQFRELPFCVSFACFQHLS